MVRETVGPVVLKLILDNGDEEASICGADADLDSARERLLDYLGDLQPGTSVAAEMVAEPGSDCRWCPVRSSCSSYLHTAPEWWTDVPLSVGAAPSDTWGEVVRTVEKEESTEVHLTDAAGRAVLVRGLDRRRHLAKLEPGSECWFFDVVPVNRRIGFRGERPHPRLFHELPVADSAAIRAWTATVFVDGE